LHGLESLTSDLFDTRSFADAEEPCDVFCHSKQQK